MKIFFTSILILISVFTFSQEGPVLKPIMENDSAQFSFERQLEYQQLLSGQVPDYISLEIPQLPKFDFNTEFANRYYYNSYSINTMPNTFVFNGMNAFISPFYTNGAVFSEGAFKINDKFTMGGYSYGANSIMSAPLPNQEMNKFDTYGSTFFMQYKVSKKFKIETRISVSQGPKYPGF